LINFIGASLYFYIPYELVKGSLNIPISGVVKVNIINKMAMIDKNKIFSVDDLQIIFSEINKRLS
jgi:hypothetical protein